MQGQRTFLLVLLALILGFVLGWGICKSRKTEALKETDYLVTDPGQPFQAAVSGNVITWRRQDSGLDAFTITVPDGLCPSSPPFVENDNGTMSAAATGDEVVVCNVVDQTAKPGAPPPTYYFNFDTTVTSHRQTVPPTQDQKNGGLPPKEGPQIAGSCQGCGSAMGQAPSYDSPLAPGKPIKAIARPTAAVPPMTQPPYKIYCTSGQASVAPIVIPPTVTINDWVQVGLNNGWSVHFTNGTPCSNGDTFNNYDNCYLDSNASLNTPYQYTAHLNQCPAGGNSADAPGTLTIQPSSVPQRK